MDHVSRKNGPPDLDPTRTRFDRPQDEAAELGREARRTLDDAWITMQVKAALMQDSLLGGLDIGVGTEAGSVRLTGELESVDQVITAESLAAGTRGVRRVYNDLRVKARS